MLHSKFVALNLVKAAMIVLLILSCIPFVGCGKADKKADEVDMLMQRLKDNDGGVRRGAARALGNIKDASAVEPLIAALKDNDGHVRWCAAEALGKIKDTRAVEPLIAALKDKDEYVQRCAAEALGKISAPAVEPLIAALKDNDGSVRWCAAEALGKIKDARAVEPLIAALKDKNEYVRRDAAVALGEIKDTRAVEPLIAALLKDEHSRRVAAQALGNIRDARAVEPLIVALKNEDKDVRRRVADVLGETGDKRAFSPLVENLCDWYSNDNAASALSKLGWIPKSDMDKIHFCVGLRAGKTLKKYWNTTKDVLLKDVKSNDYCTIENALYAFVAIGKSEIIPVLIETLNTAGNKTMAEAYLNCGHSGLGKVAKEWASRHGYTIYTGAGAAPVGWGQW